MIVERNSTEPEGDLWARINSEAGTSALPRAFDHGHGQALEGDEVRSPGGVDLGKAKAGQGLIRGQAQEVASGAVDVEEASEFVGHANHVGRCFQDGAEALGGLLGAGALGNILGNVTIPRLARGGAAKEKDGGGNFPLLAGDHPALAQAHRLAQALAFAEFFEPRLDFLVAPAHLAHRAPRGWKRAGAHEGGGGGGVDGNKEDVVAHELDNAHHHRGALEERAQRRFAFEQLAGDAVALGHLTVEFLIAPAQFDGALADAGLKLLPGLLEENLGLFASGDIRDAADVAGEHAVLNLGGELSQHPGDGALGKRKAEVEVAKLFVARPVLEHAPAVQRMHRGQPALAIGRFRGNAGHGAPLFVDVNDLPARIHAEDAHRGDAGKLAVLRAAFLQFGRAAKDAARKVIVERLDPGLGDAAPGHNCAGKKNAEFAYPKESLNMDKRRDGPKCGYPGTRSPGRHAYRGDGGDQHHARRKGPGGKPHTAPKEQREDHGGILHLSVQQRYSAEGYGGCDGEDAEEKRGFCG